MNEIRDFKGIWIPKEIWFDERLSPLDKIVLMEIDSLDCGENGCYASNKWLSSRCQCSERKITEAISKLKKLGMITFSAFDGRTRTLRSCLEKTATPPSKNHEAASQKLLHSNKESNKGSNKEKSISIDDDDGFEEFWDAYPKKVEKKAAQAIWDKLKPNPELRQIILADLRHRLEPGGAWYRKEKQYIKNASGYLNGRRWEDETEVTRIAKSARPAEVQLTEEQRAIIDRLTAEGFNYG